MPGRDLHTKMVGWLKVALPLTALVLLSTLFLLSDRIDPTDAIPYAKVDVQDLADDPRMSAPTYAGTTSDGAGITLAAGSLRPEGNQGGSADGVIARMETPDGAKIDIAAATATLDQAGGKLDLAGSVIIETDSGYRLTTDGLTAELDQTHVASTAPVTVKAPMGDISADKFTLSQDPADPRAYLLVFNGSVRLLYQPGGPAP